MPLGLSLPSRQHRLSVSNLVGRHVNATGPRQLNATGAKSVATVGRRRLHEFALDPNKYAEATPPLSGVTEGVRHVPWKTCGRARLPRKFAVGPCWPRQGQVLVASSTTRLATAGSVPWAATWFRTKSRRCSVAVEVCCCPSWGNRITETLPRSFSWHSHRGV